MESRYMQLFRVSLMLYVLLYVFVCLLVSLPLLLLHLFFVSVLALLITSVSLGQSESSNFVKVDDCLGLVAHRACGDDGCVENSLEALRLCVANGAKCVEFDVSFTLDHVAVVFHDDTLTRLVSKAQLKDLRSNRVDQLTFNELRNLDLSHKDKEDEDKDEKSPVRIPTLDEFVEEALRLDVNLILDLKTWSEPFLTRDTLTALFTKHPSLYKKAIVSSFFPHLIYLIRHKDRDIHASMAYRPHFLAWEAYAFPRPRMRSPQSLTHLMALSLDFVLEFLFRNVLHSALGLSAVLLHKDAINVETVDVWQRVRGVRIVAWTVNDSLQNVYLKDFLGVDTMSDSMDKLSKQDFVHLEDDSEEKETEEREIDDEDLQVMKD